MADPRNEFCEHFEAVLDEVLRMLPKQLARAFLDSAHAQLCPDCQHAFTQAVGRANALRHHQDGN